MFSVQWPKCRVHAVCRVPNVWCAPRGQSMLCTVCGVPFNASSVPKSDLIKAPLSEH